MNLVQDPWDRKESERRQFQKQRQGNDGIINLIMHNQRPLVFIICFIILLSCEIPAFSPLIRLILTCIGTVSTIIFLALYGDFSRVRSKQFWHPPHVLFLLSIASSLVAYAIGPDRGLAMGELLRLAAGASTYLYSSLALRNRQEIIVFLSGVIVLGCSIALYDISHFATLTRFNSHIDAGRISILGTHESIGSFMAILLIIGLSISFSNVIIQKYRVIFQSICIIIIFEWIIVRCRSAWIGGFIGIGFLFMLLVCFGFLKSRKKLKHRNSQLSSLISSPILFLVGALLFLGIAGGVAPLLSSRLVVLSNVLEDSSFNSRLDMWNGALRMMSERPKFGWGLGSYILMQGEWTHLGDSPQQVLLFGTGHQNIAHNYYVQWAAETGIIGIFLFIFSILSILAYGIYQLRSIKDRLDRLILCGVISGLVCGLTEVIGSPAFQFSGVWSFFWAIAGLIFALDRNGVPKIPVYSTLISALVSLAIAFGLFTIGKNAWNPRGENRGVFQIIERTIGPYMPGDKICWRASYRDANGKECSTFPGTSWAQPVWNHQENTHHDNSVLTKELVLERAPFSSSDLLQGYSELTVRIPEGITGLIHIQAFYRDRFGRNYSAMRVVNLGTVPLPNRRNLSR